MTQEATKVQSQHTPGPWHYFCSGFGHTVYSGTMDNPTIVHDRSWQGDGRAEADARLIAAAPDLLKALLPFIGATLTADGKIIGLMREDFDRARAAVAKATPPVSGDMENS